MNRKLLLLPLLLLHGCVPEGVVPAPTVPSGTRTDPIAAQTAGPRILPLAALPGLHRVSPPRRRTIEAPPPTLSLAAGAVPGTTHQALTSAPFGAATVSGFVTEASSGRGVQQARIVTEPATSAGTSNASGLYVLALGSAYGRLTLRAQKEGYVQARPTCINLKPGLNTLADIFLTREEDLAAGESEDCVPACGAGSRCLQGSCISRCLPLCSCSERCTANGTCEPDPDAPLPACGAGSTDLGGGICVCDVGLVLAADGRSCLEPTVQTRCPANAITTATGCECTAGLIPDSSGTRCVPPYEAAEIVPFRGAEELRRLPLPLRAPRGLAYDGEAFWVGDAAIDQLYRLRWPPGAEQAEVLEQRPLERRQGLFLVDLAWAGGQLHTASGPLLRQTRSGVSGVAASGVELLTLEQDRIEPRDLLLGQIGITRTVELAGVAWFDGYDPRNDPRYVLAPALALQHLAYTRNQLLAWGGTRCTGPSFAVDIVVLNGAHPARAPELGRFSLPLGGTHVAGLEAYGSRLWLILGGAGQPEPRLVELELQP